MKISSVRRVVSSALIVIMLILLNPNRVQAASPYDDVIETVDSLILQPAFNPTCQIDITSNWAGEYANTLNGSDRTSFENRAAWAVSQVYGDDGAGLQPTVIYVYWWDASDLPDTAAFNTDTLSAHPTHSGAIYVNNDCDVVGTVFPAYSSVNLAYTNSPYVRVYPFAISGIAIDYPTGYEGETVRNSFTPKYVAMGDSYSSGEGSFDYLKGGGNCHRSEESYAYYLKNSLALDPFSFVACSGAVTDDMFNPNPANPTEYAQLDYLTTDTEFVTLTIGGNDMGFSEVLNTCVSSGSPGWGCSTDTSLNSSLTDRLDGLSGAATTSINGRDIHSISEVLDAIDAKAPDAKIFIAGYPKLFGSSTLNFDADTSAPGQYKCSFLGGSYSYTDTQWMNGWVEDVNGVIDDAVDAAVLDGIDATYVPPALFGGHGLCDMLPSYLNGIELSDTFPPFPLSESFHPTPTGHEYGYGLAFETLMD